MIFLIPHILASPQSTPFPDIGFQDFNDFIINNFGNKISLPTVIMMLLSMANNTVLLSLHFKQNPGSKATSWIKSLACAIIEQLGDNTAETLFSESAVLYSALPFLQESARIHWNPLDSAGMEPDSTGMGLESAGIHGNETGIELELSEIRLARYIYTNMNFCAL